MLLVPIVVGLLLDTTVGAGRASLTGVVKDAESRPLSGAVVFIYTAHPRSGTSTTCPSCYLDCRKRAQTSASGEFTIPSVDPALLFRVGATAEGHLASFRENVDPAVGPITITLAAKPPLPDDPRRVVRARLVDGDGSPVFGALVDAIGYEMARPGGWNRMFGPIGVDPTITDLSGAFDVAIPKEVDSLFLSVEARGLAPKLFGRVPTGQQVDTLRMGPGRSIKGRILRDGQPISGAVVGAAQVSRSAETFVGERTAETDAAGRFLLLNLPPDEPLVVYGKLEGLGGRGAMGERAVESGPEGGTLDLGEIALEPGVALSGQVVLSDGKAIPSHTRIALDRMRAWDHTEQELGPGGTFHFGPLPREVMNLSVRVPGYELSSENASVFPDYGDSRASLAGRLEGDAVLRVLLVPARDRGRAKPPRSSQEWRVLNAKREAVRARPLQGVPPVH